MYKNNLDSRKLRAGAKPDPVQIRQGVVCCLSSLHSYVPYALSSNATLSIVLNFSMSPLLFFLYCGPYDLEKLVWRIK